MLEENFLELWEINVEKSLISLIGVFNKENSPFDSFHLESMSSFLSDTILLIDLRKGIRYLNINEFSFGRLTFDKFQCNGYKNFIIYQNKHNANNFTCWIVCDSFVYKAYFEIFNKEISSMNVFFQLYLGYNLNIKETYFTQDFITFLLQESENEKNFVLKSFVKSKENDYKIYEKYFYDYDNINLYFSNFFNKNTLISDSDFLIIQKSNKKKSIIFLQKLNKVVGTIECCNNKV